MPRRKTPSQHNTPVEELWNLSQKTGGWLRRIGIATYGDLTKRDLIEVWLILREEYPQVSKLMYYALWGAVNNCHWNLIPGEEKAKLP